MRSCLAQIKKVFHKKPANNNNTNTNNINSGNKTSKSNNNSSSSDEDEPTEHCHLNKIAENENENEKQLANKVEVTNKTAAAPATATSATVNNNKNDKKIGNEGGSSSKTKQQQSKNKNNKGKPKNNNNNNRMATMKTQNSKDTNDTTNKDCGNRRNDDNDKNVSEYVIAKAKHENDDNEDGQQILKGNNKVNSTTFTNANINFDETPARLGGIADDKVSLRNNSSNHESGQQEQEQHVKSTSKLGVDGRFGVGDTVDGIGGVDDNQQIATKTLDKSQDNNLRIYEHKDYKQQQQQETTTTAAAQTPHSFIDEYKTFVEDSKHLAMTAATPYPDRDFCNFEEAFNLNPIKTLQRKQSNSTDTTTTPATPTFKRTNTPTITLVDFDDDTQGDVVLVEAVADDTDVDAKTPEEIEYEANVAAESEDVMTPLPSSNTKSFNFGRNMQPEIIEIIRNMDAHALRINNLTLEDKMELLRRFDSQQQQQQHTHHHYSHHHQQHQQHHHQQQQQQQQQRRHSRGYSRKGSSHQLGSVDVDSNAGVGNSAAAAAAGDISPEVILRRNLIKHIEQEKENLSDCDACHVHTTKCLFERRQPKTPKLKLFVKSSDTDKEPSKKIKEVLHSVIIEDLQKNLMDLKYPTVLPPNPQLKALLVFHKADNICEVVTQACHRQQLDVTVVKSKEAALECLTNANITTTTTTATAATPAAGTANNSTATATTTTTTTNSSNNAVGGGGGGGINTSSDCYHLIIIDARSSKYLDAEYITRTIRHMSGHHFTTIIAVVKKSFFEKDDVLIALLDAGVNRCMVETTNLALCSMELKQILHSIVRPHNVMSTQQALYTALHRLKEVLIITDDHLRIQYANKSAERLLNMRLDEIISKPLADIFVSDVSSISAHGKPVREFDGILTVRRKSQDGIPMHVRVVPVACIGRTPTHYIFNFDVPGGQTDFIATLPQPKEAPRGSLHSIRRGSFDVRSVASDGLRRTSLAKLTSLPLEAPITKIINLLSQVQENCSSDEARLIDKVMDFLKREGLYSPQMKEIRTEDPIASDLIGALLTGPSLYSSRRSSNDSIIRVSTSTRPSSAMPAKMKATPLIMELLEESLSWEFDIFKLEDITERHPLLYLGMEMFRRFNVFETFNIEESVCKGWLAVIEANYHAQNSYHNSTHAADVMQATGAFLNQLATKDMGMDRMDEVTALIAAAAHDIDHPGRSSAFLCNSNSPLAILYNDLTVLESHHAATTFKLTLEDDKINIFKNLDKDTYKSVRSTIIDMILATEMTRHFEHLAKFVSVFGTDVEPRDIVQTEDESSILIRRMLIKVADVSNPARPTAFCVEWARRIAEEYFTQTDEEKARALPIVMPMFDRATCSIPKSQIGFIEYIIQDMMHAWDSFIDMPQLITYMQINYSQWKKYEEQGILTLADIKSKQVSLNAKKGTCK